MNKNCIYFTRFIPDANKDGGSRRAAQLCNAFSFLSPRISSALSLNLPAKSYTPPKSFKSKFFNSLKEKKIDKQNLWHETFRPSIDFFNLVSQEWITSVLEKESIHTALIDDPIYFEPLVLELRKKKIPTIAFAQNIESLVPGQMTPEKQKDLFMHELAVLNRCNLVVTISREDTVILNNFGINTFFFPYYPDEENLQRLKKIRLQRKITTKQGVLIIGSAGNRPTAMGMVTAIENWEKYDLNRSIGKLIVAGYHTESLKERIAQYNVELLGTVLPQKLDQLLEDVKACLCYQESGSGALTRITDMLIAGVPVIANTHAARSYYNLPGIFEFFSFANIKNALQDERLWEREIPIMLPPDQYALESAIMNLL